MNRGHFVDGLVLHPWVDGRIVGGHRGVFSPNRKGHPMTESTSNPLRFFAAGVPAPQGSKRPFTNGGRTVLVEMSKGLPVWRRDVCAAVAAGVVVESPIDVAVSVAATFVMPRPKRLAKVQPTPPFVKAPDLDKLQRGLGDALVTAGVLADDDLIVQWLASKRYAEPSEATGAWVSVFTGAVAVSLSEVAA
ncbi:RusA family crossover junction endodeoxyribonuclease [Tsukamurella tyrosinosolvens]|uniref:RusA family crossover junction endodeoxyribonuclease n=1 Tax=Tsukamurella tyrosinosolvens TaxID=57704 RepID=UPI002DD429E1|nr:RusA family crossover junction endodeoxyribonuclease [Tsukamurella tyrosinosolvens]MEC4616288.1 RusA family crossover junction endodeoxyribonuclease [Tsukamurella tyrosinosolvens]